MLFAGCSNHSSENFDAGNELSAGEQQKFIDSVIRYGGHLAPKAAHDTKYSEEFDEYYIALARSHNLELFYKQYDGTQFFLLTRKAPSRFDREVAIGGQVRFSEERQILHYEEVFRTWKMERAELMEKAAMLFSQMVAGNDLSRYYPENSGDDEYIEFPNSNTRFDTVQRRWVTSLFDPSAERVNFVNNQAEK